MEEDSSQSNKDQKPNIEEKISQTLRNEAKEEARANNLEQKSVKMEKQSIKSKELNKTKASKSNSEESEENVLLMYADKVASKETPATTSKGQKNVNVIDSPISHELDQKSVKQTEGDIARKSSTKTK